MYLEIDEGFPTHPKTLRLARYMGDPAAPFYLIKLWAWACRSSPDGNLEGLTPDDVEEVCGYRAADGRLFDAMKRAGFVDVDEDGVPVGIHKWKERTGGAIEQMRARADAIREQTRERTRKWREKKPAVTPTVTDGDASQERHATSRDVPRQDQSRQDQDQEQAGPRARAEDRVDEQREEPQPPHRERRGRWPAGPWAAGRWFDTFAVAWSEKYQRIYGSGGVQDARAVGDLADFLDGLPRPEREDAELAAARMFGEYLADESPAAVKARHPWRWFVERFNGLRAPRMEPREGLHAVRAGPVARGQPSTATREAAARVLARTGDLP